MTLTVFTVDRTRSVTVIAVDTGIFTSYNKYRYTCKNKERSVSFAFLQSVLNNLYTTYQRKNITFVREKKTKETILGYVTIYCIFLFRKKNESMLCPCFVLYEWSVSMCFIITKANVLIY